VSSVQREDLWKEKTREERLSEASAIFEGRRDKVDAYHRRILILRDFLKKDDEVPSKGWNEKKTIVKRFTEESSGRIFVSLFKPFRSFFGERMRGVRGYIIKLVNFMTVK